MKEFKQILERFATCKDMKLITEEVEGFFANDTLIEFIEILRV